MGKKQSNRDKFRQPAIDMSVGGRSTSEEYKDRHMDKYRYGRHRNLFQAPELGPDQLATLTPDEIKFHDFLRVSIEAAQTPEDAEEI